MADKELDKLLDECNNARDAADRTASASTPSLIAILAEIKKTATKGYSELHITLPASVSDDEVLRTTTILKARGFKITADPHNQRILKLNWI